MAPANRTIGNDCKPTGPRRWALLCAVCGVVTSVGVVGCRAKAKNFDNENDALRREVLELRTRNQRLEGEVGELRAKLSEAASVQRAATGASADVVAALPRCASIEIGARSGWSRDGTGVEVLVETLDARRRFVQVAGTLTVDVTRLPASRSDGAGKAETVGSVTLSPADLREAYRSTFMGTHYLVVVPVGAGVKDSGGTVVIRAVLADGVTGVSHENTRVLK